MDSLYQEKILNWAKQSRVITPLSGVYYSAIISNPLCGDRVEVCLHINANKVITDLSTEVRGCALCEAGAGLAVECFTGRSDQEIRQLTDDFSNWLKGLGTEAPIPQMQDFSPVQNIRNRHKCVLLACHATLKALSAQ